MVDEFTEIRNELKKYKTMREMIVYLSQRQIGKIYYGDRIITVNYVPVYDNNLYFGACCKLCRDVRNIRQAHILDKNNNTILFGVCKKCFYSDDNLCTTCFRRLDECKIIKQKTIISWIGLRRNSFPKDIIKIIISKI